MSDGDLIRRDMIRLAVHMRVGVGSCGIECHDICGSGELLDVLTADPVAVAALRLAEAVDREYASGCYGAGADVGITNARVDALDAYRAARGGSHGR